ncbi:MAG: hypothetical protein IT164_11295 [Bryobacterales bacterium]|nr:hypothetical protein [Bryobacterales bacterium]
MRGPEVDAPLVEPLGGQEAVPEVEQTPPSRVADEGEGSELLEARLEKRMNEMFAVRVEAVRAEHGRESDAAQARVRELLAELAANKNEIESLRADRSYLEREFFIKKRAQELGVENTDLIHRAVRDDLVERTRGNWVAVVDGRDVPATQYLAEFVRNNPELLPPRRTHGGGVPVMRPDKVAGVDLEEIRPGMDPGTVKRVREAIGRVIGQNRTGL